VRGQNLLDWFANKKKILKILKEIDMSKKLYFILTIMLICAFALTACETAEPVAEEAPAEEPAAEEPAAEEAPAAEEEAAACLVIGATYGGPINDAGYNQAMHESVMAIKQNIDCVEIVEAENVYDEAGATTTIEQMIQQGAQMIIATAFSHQYPALELSFKYPDVIFEHAGGWEMGDNFANFFGEPPDVWFAKGVAAGKMTNTDRLGFVAAFPLGWTLTFANAFNLGAKSVNPDVVTEVQFTYAWGDSTKEAEVTNNLINSGADVITMHVDSPATVLSTAESRGVYSIGFQSLAAQQFAPEYWIVGSGYTLGDKLTWLASTVIDGTWTPIFLRCGLKDGCMALSDFGPEVPQEVQNLVLQTVDDLDAGAIVTFAGPIADQDGNVVVAEGDVLTDDLMANVDWMVDGMVGSPK
jgi:basic membrane protein A